MCCVARVHVLEVCHVLCCQGVCSGGVSCAVLPGCMFWRCVISCVVNFSCCRSPYARGVSCDVLPGCMFWRCVMCCVARVRVLEVHH